MDNPDFSHDEEASGSSVEPNRFWARQFRQQATDKQRVYDWAFGVVVPTICVAADPIVFKGNLGSILTSYRPFAYLLSSVSILAMAAWLLWGDKLRWMNAPIAGLFVFGSGVCLIVGVVLLPFSIVGMFFIIGFLGFTPLLSAIAFLRNGIRAYRSSWLSLDRATALQAGVLAAVFSFVTPYVVNLEINRSVSAILTGDSETIRYETRKLKLVWPLVGTNEIGRRYHRVDPGEWERKDALKAAYEELSGTDVDSAWMLRD